MSKMPKNWGEEIQNNLQSETSRSILKVPKKELRKRRENLPQHLIAILEEISKNQDEVISLSQYIENLDTIDLSLLLPYFGDLTALRLNGWRVNVNEMVCRGLSLSLISLLHLDLSHSLIDDTCLAILLANLRSLRTINLSFCERISNDGIRFSFFIF